MTLLFLNQYTKILKLLELYWFKEVFIARVIKENGIQQNARGDQLHVMDQKFDILCHEIFHIEILVDTFANSPDSPLVQNILPKHMEISLQSYPCVGVNGAELQRRMMLK